MTSTVHPRHNRSGITPDNSGTVALDARGIGSRIRRRLAVALDDAMQPFLREIRVVSVRVEDVNGDRGGIDKECRVRVLLRHGRPVHVVYRHSSVGAAVHEALQLARNRVAERVAMTRRARR